MIVLYSGTQGSGKSLDCARTIYNWCRRKQTVLCNFPVNVDNIRLRGKKDVRFIPNAQKAVTTGTGFLPCTAISAILLSCAPSLTGCWTDR